METSMVPVQIDVPIYGHTIIFCTTLKSLRTFCTINDIDLSGITNDDQTVGFTTQIQRQHSHRQGFIVFVNSNYKPDDLCYTLGVLAHELHHVVDDLFKSIGENGTCYEPKAYLIGYLYQKCARNLMKNVEHRKRHRKRNSKVVSTS